MALVLPPAVGDGVPRVGIDEVQMQALVGRRRWQRSSVQLGEIGREDVVGDARGVAAVDAVLEEDDAGDGRVIAWREKHEPAMVAQVPQLARALRRE